MIASVTVIDMEKVSCTFHCLSCYCGSYFQYLSIICLTICSGADQRKHQSSESLAFMRESTGDRSPRKGPVTYPLRNTDYSLCLQTKGLVCICTFHINDIWMKQNPVIHSLIEQKQQQMDIWWVIQSLIYSIFPLHDNKSIISPCKSHQLWWERNRLTTK